MNIIIKLLFSLDLHLRKYYNSFSIKFILRCSADGSFEHDRCQWQNKGVRKGAKQGVMRNGSEQNDYVLTVSHVVARSKIFGRLINILIV